MIEWFSEPIYFGLPGAAVFIECFLLGYLCRVVGLACLRDLDHQIRKGEQ